MANRWENCKFSSGLPGGHEPVWSQSPRGMKASEKRCELRAPRGMKASEKWCELRAGLLALGCGASPCGMRCHPPRVWSVIAERNAFTNWSNKKHLLNMLNLKDNTSERIGNTETDLQISKTCRWLPAGREEQRSTKQRYGISNSTYKNR